MKFDFLSFVIALLINGIIFLSFLFFFRKLQITDWNKLIKNIGAKVVIKAILLFSLLIIANYFYKIQNPTFVISLSIFFFCEIIGEVLFINKFRKK